MAKQFQHTISKFYLKNFEINDKVISSINGKFYVQNPSKIFGENNIYGDRDSIIETEMSKLESDSAPLIQKIIDSKNVVTLLRRERESLAYFLSFLPRRNKSMENLYKNNFKTNIIEGLEFDLAIKDYISEPLHKFTMTIWESQYDLPLFPESIGNNEVMWGTRQTRSGEINLEDDYQPDTLYFPLSNRKILIFVNPKWRFDFRHSNIEELINNMQNYCERSIFVAANIQKIWKSIPTPNYIQGDLSKVPGFLIPKCENDLFEYKIGEFNYYDYKYYVVNVILNALTRGYDDVVIQNKDEYIELVKEIYNDLLQNQEWNNEKYDMQSNWYYYGIYKMSHPETLELFEKYITKLMKENY